MDQAVARALAENPDAEVVLLAHSIGGWIARAWLSEWAASDVKKRVKKLVTLGSPHQPPPADTAAAKIDQTRGLLSYVDSNFPGSYEKGVEYVSVIGSGVVGRVALFGAPVPAPLAATATGASTVVETGTGGLAGRVESLVAYSSYAVLSGASSEQAGDGIIPVAVAQLAGAKLVVLPATKHSNFVPTPGKSLKLSSFRWYGDALDQWVQYLL